MIQFLSATGSTSMTETLFTLLPMILIIVFMFILIYLPQKRQDKKDAAMRSSIEIGDKVSTIGGIVGIVCAIADKDDTIVLETGSDRDRVYTHDLYTLEHSPRLGAGVMEITASTFPWWPEYDEIDYVLEGTLEIQCCGQTVRAKQGELLLIPKGSEIHFSAPDYAKFLYFTYPADWQAQ